MVKYISSNARKAFNANFIPGSGMAIVGLLLFLASCVGVSKSELSRAKAVAESKEQFAANPFGFQLTLENFEAAYGKLLKRQRYTMESIADKSKTDTIYCFYKGNRFFKRKTEVFFFKPMNLEAKPMAGNIYKPEIELRNEIKVGMTRKEFFWRFSDWSYDNSESLTLDSPATGCNFTFVFSRDKLKAIRFTVRKI